MYGTREAPRRLGLPLSRDILIRGEVDPQLTKRICHPERRRGRANALYARYVSYRLRGCNYAETIG